MTDKINLNTVRAKNGFSPREISTNLNQAQCSDGENGEIKGPFFFLFILNHL